MDWLEFGQTTGSDLLGQGIGMLRDYYNRQWQEKMLDKQNNWQEEMWQKNNEYNSPANQLELIKAAGLHPSLLMSKQGSNPMIGSTAMSGGSIPPASSTMGDDIWTKYLQNKYITEEIKGKQIENEWTPILNQQGIKEAEARINELQARKYLTEQEANQIKELLPLLKRKNEMEIEEIQARIKQTEAQTAKLSQEKAVLVWQNEFRELFGVDPTSPSINMLIQAILKGKGKVIIDALFNTATDVIETTFENIPDFSKHILPFTYKPLWTQLFDKKTLKNAKDSVKGAFKNSWNTVFLGKSPNK